MQARVLQFRPRTWKGYLALAVFATLAAGLVALIIFVGFFVLLAGLAVSGIAALVYSAKRLFVPPTSSSTLAKSEYAEAPRSVHQETIDIQVDEILR